MGVELAQEPAAAELTHAAGLVPPLTVFHQALTLQGVLGQATVALSTAEVAVISVAGALVTAGRDDSSAIMPIPMLWPMLK